MSPAEVVKNLLVAIEMGEFERAAQYLSDDFVFSGWTPQPLNQKGFLAMMSVLKSAMPDFNYHLSEVVEEGNKVRITTQITGTQTQDLILPLDDSPTISAQDIYAILPPEIVEFAFNAGKVSSMKVETIPGGGTAGLIQQLGNEINSTVSDFNSLEEA